MEDDKIIALYFDRDEEAIKETNLAYGKKLFRLASSILASKEDSDECVNDTYWKAWNNIPPTKPTFFYAYLSKICRHLAFDILDHKKAQKRNFKVVELSAELENVIPDNVACGDTDEKELYSIINEFLRTLSKDNRVIFINRYFFMYSVAEISRKHHYSQSKVKTSLFRSREKLRTYLEKEGVYL